MVEPRPYWSFEDVYKLTTKVEKQPKCDKGLPTKSSINGVSFFKGVSSSKVKNVSTKDKSVEANNAI